MRLACTFCQHQFQSAFGPPNVRCPKCGSRDVLHTDQLGGMVGPPPIAARGPEPYRFQSTRADFEAPPDSVPPTVLNNLPWLAASVALAVFCQPVGLAGIYFADQAKTLARRGDLAAARTKLGYARLCVIGGFAFVAIATFIAMVIIVLNP